MVQMATTRTKTLHASIVNRKLDNSQCHATTSVTPLPTVDVVEAVVNGRSQTMVKPVPVNVILMFHPISTPWESIVADFNRQYLRNYEQICACFILIEY